ncbi:MAG: hypothetical protein ABFC34_06615 [Methanobacterium sp.]
MTLDDNIKRMLDEYTENLVTINTSFVSLPLQNYSNQISQRITTIMPDFSPLIINAFEPYQKALAKLSTKKFEQDLQESAKIMFDNRWWFIPTMPPTFYLQLLKAEDVNQQNLTDFLVKYHNKDNCAELNNIIKRWKLDEFNENMEIFEDALWAHKESKFTLTVPALTIQVEGIFRSYLDHMSEDNFFKYKTELKTKYGEAIKNEDKILGFERFIAIQNMKFLDKTMEIFTLRVSSIPQDYDELYRNALFHGLYKNYSSIEMSTKTILLLDMLHRILSDLEKYEDEN